MPKMSNRLFARHVASHLVTRGGPDRERHYPFERRPIADPAAMDLLQVKLHHDPEQEPEPEPLTDTKYTSFATACAWLSGSPS